MKLNTKTTGNEGEKIAAYFLTKQGYELLATNWFFEKAEIDIIAKIDQTIVFVEVKTRTNQQFGHPEQSITKAKQKHIARAASEYIYQLNHQGEIRYDIISIYLPKKQPPEILHLKDAFFPIL